MSNPYIELIQVVKDAGKLLLDYWPGGSGAKKLASETKDDGSLVTSADYASNEIILAGLKRLFPSDSILSEEVPVGDDFQDSGRLWIIDPLDGTQTFADGNSDFSILVGLTEKEHRYFGLMYFPAKEVLAMAEAETEATINGNTLNVSNSKSIRPQAVYIRKFTCTQPELAYPRWMDSGYALLSVANGKFDGVIIKLDHHKQWDLAAPSIIIEKAGGKITDENGDPFIFTAKNFNYKYFVASNSLVHEELLELIPKDGDS